jgi:hypothetical protein
MHIRHVSYLSEDLKAEMKARFELDDTKFYTLPTLDLERFLSEMIAPVSKAEFLSMIKETVHFTLPVGYTPTEQTLTIFLYQLLVYKEKMFRAVEFILLHAPSDSFLPACNSKPQGLLKLISEEVPHRYIALILESDVNGTKYENMYKFFARVAVHTKRCEELHRESKFFRSSFGGSQFELAQRNAASGSSSSANTSATADKTNPTITTEATTVKTPVPFNRWTPRAQPTHPVVAVMKTIYEDDNDENEDPSDNDQGHPHEQSTCVVMTASEKLGKGCYNMISKNYCNNPSCEYSHDAGVIAAARDKQIIELTNTKREVQAGHQAVMKTFEKQGAKGFKQTTNIIERKPHNPESAPQLSLLRRSSSPILDEHLGREHECFQRIALLSQRFRANILSHGCQTDIVILCMNTDLIVKAMLDTGCSPGNYMSEEYFMSNIKALQEFLVPCPAERVDLATSNSAQSITKHVIVNVRHVDSRGVTRCVKLRFGVLHGLRFDVVIGLYAIALNFMDVMQDLLTIQLEHQESRTPTLAMLYGQQPQLLMISRNNDDETDKSSDSMDSITPQELRPPIIAGLTLEQACPSCNTCSTSGQRHDSNRA